MRTKKIDIQPDPSLFSKLGKTGYTIPKAFAELIDNSIDNRIDNYVKVNIRFQVLGNEIRIKDNAKGMNEEELTNALKIGFHNKNNNKTIGEYGFGLKSAISFLGKSILIYTKRENTNEIIKFSYKEEAFINSDKAWEAELQIIDSSKMKEEIGEDFKSINKNGNIIDRGTLIIINDLNIKLYQNYASETEKGRLIAPLEKIYMLAIGNILDIEFSIINKDGSKNKIYILKPYQFPGLMFKTNFEFDILQEKYDMNNNQIKKLVRGWIGISAPSIEKNTKKGNGIYTDSGFLLTKNGKIISENITLGYNFHPESRLIRGLIELGDFETTTNKDSFIKNEDWQLLEKAIGKIFVEPIKKISSSDYIKKIRGSFESDNINIDINKDFNNVFKRSIDNLNKYELSGRVLNIKNIIDDEVWNRYRNGIKLQDEEIISFNNITDDSKDKTNNIVKENIINNNNDQICQYRIKQGKNEIVDKEIIIKELGIIIKHSTKTLSRNLDYEWFQEKNILFVESNKENIQYKNYQTRYNYLINNIKNVIFEYCIVQNNLLINKDILKGIRREINSMRIEL